MVQSIFGAVPSNTTLFAACACPFFYTTALRGSAVTACLTQLLARAPLSSIYQHRTSSQQLSLNPWPSHHDRHRALSTSTFTELCRRSRRMCARARACVWGWVCVAYTFGVCDVGTASKTVCRNQPAQARMVANLLSGALLLLMLLFCLGSPSKLFHSGPAKR